MTRTTAYEAYRAHGVMKDGRRFGRPADPFVAPALAKASVNITDPDSQSLKSRRGYKQGYNARAVVTEGQIVVSPEINTDSPEFGRLEPMIDAARRQLRKIGIFHKLGVWSRTPATGTEQMDSLAAQGIPLLIPPDAGKRKTARPAWGRRAVHLDALPPRDREWTPAVPKTPRNSRAGVRPDCLQPQTYPVSPKRPRRRTQ